MRDGLGLCGLAALAILAGCGEQTGLRGADRRLAARFGALAFDTAAWRTAGRADRGRMVADLDRRHRLAGVHYRAIEALLGPGECYVDYEDEPCYVVELGGERYALQFGVNHSDAPGRVLSARLYKYPPVRPAPPNGALQPTERGERQVVRLAGSSRPRHLPARRPALGG